MFYHYFGEHPPKIWSTLLKTNITPTTQSRHFWVDDFCRIFPFGGIMDSFPGEYCKNEVAGGEPSKNKTTGQQDTLQTWRATDKHR